MDSVKVDIFWVKCLCVKHHGVLAAETTDNERPYRQRGHSL